MTFYELASLVVGVVFAASASAQDIGPVRPDAVLSSPTQAQAQGVFLDDGTWTTCLLVDGADHLNPGNLFDCQPITGPTGITMHTIVVTPLGGDVVVRAVTVNAAGIPSEPSTNIKTVFSIPFAPLVTQ